MQPSERNAHIENINTATRLRGLTGFAVQHMAELEIPGQSYTYRISTVMDHPQPGRRLVNTLNALIHYAASRGTVDAGLIRIEPSGKAEQTPDGLHTQAVDITFKVAGRLEMNETITRLVLAAKTMTRHGIGQASVRELRKRTLGDQANPSQHR